MKLAKIIMVGLFALSFSDACMGCCGMCRASEVSESQQRMLDEAAAKKYAQQRDADLAYRIAQQELDSQRRRAVVAEQQRLLEDANRRKRQEERDAQLAQRIAEQELEAQRQQAVAEQQYLLNEAAARKRQEVRDAELAQRIAQQELELKRKKDDALKQDSAMAQRIAQQELEYNAKRQQIASDEALAQQLQAEEIARARNNNYSARNNPTNITLGQAALARQAIMTSALPRPANNNNLKNWTQNNDIIPKDVAPGDTLCVVCIATAQELEGKQLVKLPCKHVFCKPCMTAMVAGQTSMTCPTCRDTSDIAAVKALVR